MPEITGYAGYTANTTAWPYIQQLYERITYKPDWQFKVHGASCMQSWVPAQLVIDARVIDSFHPERTILVSHHFPIPQHMLDSTDDGMLMGWLFTCVAMVDRHEAREFMRLDGKQYNPPEHGLNARDIY